MPRSEVSRESAALKAAGVAPASNSNSPNLQPSGGNSWNGAASAGSVPTANVNSALTQSQIQNESRHACDPRISMDEYAYNKIFVGGLHYDTRDGKFVLQRKLRCHYIVKLIIFILCSRPYSTAEFRAYFERFGRVMSAEVMFNRETHKSRGFGFIVFELERGAEQVCSEREHVIDGKVVRRNE